MSCTRKWIEREQEFDPRVLERILPRRIRLAADYIEFARDTGPIMRRFTRANYDVDVMIMPRCRA